MLTGGLLAGQGMSSWATRPAVPIVARFLGKFVLDIMPAALASVNVVDQANISSPDMRVASRRRSDTDTNRSGGRGLFCHDCQHLMLAGNRLDLPRRSPGLTNLTNIASDSTIKAASSC